MVNPFGMVGVVALTCAAVGLLSTTLNERSDKKKGR